MARLLVLIACIASLVMGTCSRHVPNPWETDRVYVSPNGSDEGNGSAKRPFRTLTRALLALGPKARTIFLTAGLHRFADSVSISNLNPLLITTDPEDPAVLTMGRPLPTSAFTSVSDEQALAKIQPTLGSKILTLDLNRHGIQFDQPFDLDDGQGGLPQLFLNGQALTMSNREGTGKDTYWYLNLLEEINQPGEWCVDLSSQKLYLLPPEGFSDSYLELSYQERPLLDLVGARDLRLEHLVIEYTLGDAIHLRDCVGTSLQGLTIRGISGNAIVIAGGTNCLVQSCTMRDLGAAGIIVEAGNGHAAPRKACGHRITNNHIHRFGQQSGVVSAGIDIGYRTSTPSSGVMVDRNFIHTTPHAGIRFAGYDHLIELNEIFQFGQDPSGMAGISAEYKKGTSGNNMIRGNFIHSSPMGGAIHFDGDFHKEVIVSNVIHRMAFAPEATSGCGIQIKNAEEGTGTVYRNFVSECPVGYQVQFSPELVFARNESVDNVQPYDFSGGPLPGKLGVSTTTLWNGPIPISLEQVGLYEDKYRPMLPGQTSIIISSNGVPIEVSETESSEEGEAEEQEDEEIIIVK